MSYLDKVASLRGHLTGEARDRMIAVLSNPTQETWDDAFGLIVNPNGFLTLWRAVLAVDPTFPRSKNGDNWDRIPDYDTLWRAIRFAATGEKGA